jgi:hypothetical protein
MLDLLTKRRSNRPGRVVVWDSHRLIYVRVPKSANSSIRKSITGGVESRVDLTRLDKLYPGYLTFSFVRNPWARMVSVYTEKIRVEGTTEHKFVEGVHRGLLEMDTGFRVGMSFAEFVEMTCSFTDEKADKHLRSQCWFLVRNGVVVPNFIGRVETIEEDWQRLAKLADFNDSIGHWNKSRHGHYTEFYDERLSRLVGDRYRDDVETFGYRYGD